MLMWITKLLERWKPMWDQDLGEKMDSFVQLLQNRASHPPSIDWYPGSYSTLDSQAALGSSLFFCDSSQE